MRAGVMTHARCVLDELLVSSAQKYSTPPAPWKENVGRVGTAEIIVYGSRGDCCQGPTPRSTVRRVDLAAPMGRDMVFGIFERTY
jgi:hypothetical protein